MSYPSKSFLLCLIASALLAACESATVIRQFQSERSSPHQVVEFASVSRLTARGRLHCAALCSGRSDCLTFGFSSATSECHTSNEEPGGLTEFFGSTVFNNGLRSRAAAESSCKRAVVATRYGRLFCPIQQRVSNSSFQQDWGAYETGFGDQVNFWIGLQAIHQISAAFSTGVTLLAQLITWSSVKLQQEYPNFLVQNASTNYTMTVAALNIARSNFPYDRLRNHNGMMFSTKDRDNDLFSASCSTMYHGGSGWWFNFCATSNPNGLYPPGEIIKPYWMSWFHNFSWVSLRATRLSLIVQ